MRLWWIAVVLVVGVFLAHHSSNWLAAGSSFTPSAVFYMMQGLGSATLAALLLHYVLKEAPSYWRRISIVALGIWLIESLQLPLCRIAVADISKVPREQRTNLCDFVVGFPIGDVLMISEIVVLVVVLGMWAWNNGDDS
jgi:hypothetical protein